MRDSHGHSSLLVEEGPPYTRGRGFRARAEARQRRFRSQVLRCGFERYGHILSPEAAAEGLNFIHPMALSAARRRAARRRGLHVPKLFANMCSSQTMGFNLFAPLAQESGMKILSTALQRHIQELAMVKRIQFAYLPPPGLFGDPFTTAGVTADLLIDFETVQGQQALLSIEMKFVEPRFESCAVSAARGQTPCHADLKIADGLHGCRYVSQKGFDYWKHPQSSETTGPGVARSGQCPFSGSLWQLWVHHTLVQALGARQSMGRTIHAVCAPPGNETLQARGHVEQFAALLRDPTSIRLIPLETLVEDIANAVPQTANWMTWISKAKARYVID